jgi:hypothetical protein
VLGLTRRHPRERVLAPWPRPRASALPLSRDSPARERTPPPPAPTSPPPTTIRPLTIPWSDFLR